jgi:hypothetical protein
MKTKLKAKQIFYPIEIEKPLRQLALNADKSLTEYITHALTEIAAGRVKLCILAALLTASLLTTSCSDVLCPAYNSMPHKHRRY